MAVTTIPDVLSVYLLSVISRGLETLIHTPRKGNPQSISPAGSSADDMIYDSRTNVDFVKAY